MAGNTPCPCQCHANANAKLIQLQCNNMNQAYTRSALFTTPTNKNLTAAEETHKQTKRNTKPKRKKRWRDRISPQPPKEEPKENVIDEEKLTRCTRCPSHRKRACRFRPLINNGEYLCDSCYQTEFPLTQMYVKRMLANYLI